MALFNTIWQSMDLTSSHHKKVLLLVINGHTGLDKKVEEPVAFKKQTGLGAWDTVNKSKRDDHEAKYFGCGNPKGVNGY